MSLCDNSFGNEIAHKPKMNLKIYEITHKLKSSLCDNSFESELPHKIEFFNFYAIIRFQTNYRINPKTMFQRDFLLANGIFGGNVHTHEHTHDKRKHERNRKKTFRFREIQTTKTPICFERSVSASQWESKRKRLSTCKAYTQSTSVFWLCGLHRWQRAKQEKKIGLV